MDRSSADKLTAEVIASAARAPSDRARVLFAALVSHLHAFVREVELTPQEWLAGIHFLTRTGQMCDDLRQEFMLLSDTLGVTMLVDALAEPGEPNATESSVLGPFFTRDAPEVALGGSIASEGKGQPLFVEGRVIDRQKAPIAGAVLEVWETDGDGKYDTQYETRAHPDCRGRLRSDPDGRFSFRAVLPVSYSIPTDGPVGAMLPQLGRHSFRPAHLHVGITADGYVPLTTALYVEGDPYLDSDTVFGVKPSLVERFERHDESERAYFTVQREFVLARAPVLAPA